MDLQSQMSQFSSSQSSQASQIYSSMDLFSEPPCTNTSNASAGSSHPNCSQTQYSGYISGEDSGVLSMKVARRSNEKLYLKYLSTTSVSAAMAERQPSAVQARKQQQREGGGGGGGGGGRQLLHGAKVDFDMWKAKVDESNQRALLSEVVAIAKECKNEVAESTLAVKKMLPNVAQLQTQFADAVHARVAVDLDGQSKVLTSIVQMQQETLSLLQSLKAQSEQSDSRLLALEGKLSLLKGDQKKSLEQFQQQIQDYIATKVDLLSQKPSHFGCSGRSQNVATPSGCCTSRTKSASLSPAATFKPPPSPLLCAKSTSGGVNSQPPKDTHSQTYSPGSHPDDKAKGACFSSIGEATRCQQTRLVTGGLEVFNMTESPSTNPAPYSASQPLGRKAAASRRRKQTSASSQPGRKRRTRASTREQSPKCKVPRYSPLVHLVGDRPCCVSPHQITSCLRSVRKESTCNKPSPVNALDDSLYSSVGTPDTNHPTSASSGAGASCESSCSWSGTAFTSWRGRRQEQSKRFSHILQSRDGNDPAVQEITATILKHCNLQASTSPI